MSNIYNELLKALEKDDVNRRTYLSSGKEELYQENKKIYENSSDANGKYIEETIKPEPELVLFGAGHVAHALYKIAQIMEMKVSVIDERDEVCNRERFPNANLIVGKYDEILSHELGFFRPYYVIFTHGHKYDNKCLRYCLNHNYSYIGMIGSKGKVDATFKDLINDGYSKAQLDNVHSPIGLKIGAVTPEEIAISIMAEIISVFREKKGIITLQPDYLRSISNKSGICVRIIEKKGSAPRAVGSEMFVTQKELYGTIGGGAVEHQAIDEAREMLKSNEKIKIKEYNLSAKGDLGMICGGDVTLLYQRIDS